LAVFNGGCLETFKVTDFSPPCVYPYLLTPFSSPSWKSNRFSARQEISPHFTVPEGSLPHSQVPATCLYPEPAQFSPYPHIPLPEDPS